MEKTYNTTIHKDLTDEEYHAIVNGISSKPPLDEVKKQLAAIGRGGTKTDKIYGYFFKDIAYKTRLVYNNWSIDEGLRHKPLMEFFAGKVADNKKVFPDTMPLWKKIETAFRLCGFKTCSKPSNFPMPVIDSLLDKYCPSGGNYLDYSCGWGIRLLSALKHNVNYYGTDPNDALFPRYDELTRLYREINGTGGLVDIRLQGSETLVHEWIGKMDFVFSSPPYFSLEDYRTGEAQSYKEGTTYEEWVENYVRPTIANCAKYVKDSGVFAFNIKNNFNYIKHDLEGDWMRISLENGFELVETLPLKNITRVSGHRHSDSENTMATHENDELIQVFRKKL